MKLTVLGGGGVRAPLFVAATLLAAHEIHLDEICLMDINGGKLELMAAMSRLVATYLGSQVRISSATQAREALEGAGYIVTTLRVGFEQGRVLDERVALQHGVLGQETTGPGGFAMAMRSIPAILEYAALAAEICPKAWIFNFTNPAGLVTQALRQQGFHRTVGICDGANHAVQDAAAWLKQPVNSLRAEVFGLNHLSWTRRLWLDGKDILPALLANPEFCRWGRLRVFDFSLVQQMGLYLNEYLYYYYYAEKALASIQADEKTRGEEILELNTRLLQQLSEIEILTNPEQAIAAYITYQKRRGATYMHYADPNAPAIQAADATDYDMTDIRGEILEAEGYAGVALNIIRSFESGDPLNIALNVPNDGAITGMAVDDVVEVSCGVSKTGIQPFPIGEIPVQQLRLMQSVKLYERLAVEAILKRSRQLAVQALMAHPLVLSYSRSTALVEEYLRAHAAYVGEWD